MSDDSADADPILDLLGDPWAPLKDRRGRKRHRRMPQVAEKVAVLRAAGRTEEQIADRIGLSVPTLRKYYFPELQGDRELAFAALAEKMWDKAMEGNVPAAKFIKELFGKGQAAIPIATKPVKSDKLGKKAAADVDAKTAHQGTSWGDLLPNQRH